MGKWNKIDGPLPIGFGRFRSGVSGSGPRDSDHAAAAGRVEDLPLLETVTKNGAFLGQIEWAGSVGEQEVKVKYPV